MQITFSRVDEDHVRFILSPASEAFANSLRRSMIADVPSLAIDDVKIYDNTSALFDEMLAHRLGLIPIRTDLSCYVEREKCTCEGAGCPACTAGFTMSVEGPKMVYSRDLIPEDPKAAPAVDTIPIVKLTKDQKVVLEAKAVVSNGRAHAKWQPTNACGYKNYPVITLDEQCDACALCVDECPRQILEQKGSRVQVGEGKLEECSLCRLCEQACLNSGIGAEPAIHVTDDKDRFIFVVESDGSLPAKEIVERAIAQILARSESLIEQVTELTGEAA